MSRPTVPTSRFQPSSVSTRTEPNDRSAPRARSTAPSAATDTLIVGRIKITPQGRAFLEPEVAGLPTIVIPAGKTGIALNDDRVAVRREPSSATQPGLPANAITAHVVRVLTRKRTRHVGTLRRRETRYDVMPDDPCAPRAIRVSEPICGDRRANVGDKVVVELEDASPSATAIFGRVVEILGPPDAAGVDTLCVVRQHQLALEFPPDVERAARAFGKTVTPRDLEGRVDCREHPVITIDPKDARDFDDAFCLRKDGKNGWTLWVHVADVGHYVKPGSALDLEAKRRGNSTYLVDRVIPMLPESLSNGLCSLVPRQDRLTHCVEFSLKNDGSVAKARFYDAVIHSQRRFTYEEASVAIGDVPRDAIERMLQDAHTLAQRIRTRRFKNGALELDVPETKIHVDERGHVTHIDRTQHDGSHQLIEEFMLLANEAAATELIRKRRPALHRIHESPDPSRLAEFRAEVLRARVPCGDLRERAAIQDLLARLADVPAGAALRFGFLKSMQRARYATRPIGHFGLAKECYTHFTSPIRRYADLVVHRALRGEGEDSIEALDTLGTWISETERTSAAAERESRIVKLLAYLESQRGAREPARFTATIVDIRDFGVFIDIPSLGLGGLVHASTFERDARRGRGHRLGDEVRVQVEDIDPSSRQVSFRVVR